jgi:hypothetical protein
MSEVGLSSTPSHRGRKESQDKHRPGVGDLGSHHPSPTCGTWENTLPLWAFSTSVNSSIWLSFYILLAFILFVWATPLLPCSFGGGIPS